MDPHHLDGLALLRAVRDGDLPPPSIATTIPMTFVEVEEGRVLFRATADERHLNPLGGVHGGFAMTVLDSVTGCAVHTMLEAGVGYGTVEIDVKMMRPLVPGMRMEAEGRVLNVSRSLGFAEGTLRRDDGKTLAHATATCLIRRP